MTFSHALHLANSAPSHVKNERQTMLSWLTDDGLPPKKWSTLSDVSTHGTDLGKLIREDFWLIVTIME